MNQTQDLIQSTGNSVGRNSVPVHLVQERREYIASLKTLGLTSASILRQVNMRAKSMGWGEITIRTLQRDLIVYYSKIAVISKEEKEELDAERLAHISQMEKTIEKMSIHVSDRSRTWKPFEYQDALDKLFEMQNKLSDIKNFNLSKKNLKLESVVQSNNTVFISASSDNRATKPELISALIGHLDNVIDSLDDDQDKNIIEAEYVQSDN